MNNSSKLMLSDEELQLVNNTQWILTKRVILDKVAVLLGELAEAQRKIVQGGADWLPAEVVNTSPKISKGENYLQLPYVLLDHPRCFVAEHIFAVRTMFWWGKFFSVTLHLSGKYKQLFQEALLLKLQYEQTGVFICVHENEWHHHFGTDNYVFINEFDPAEVEQIVINKPFIKIAMKFPLQEWDALPVLLENCFGDMLKILKD